LDWNKLDFLIWQQSSQMGLLLEIYFVYEKLTGFETAGDFDMMYDVNDNDSCDEKIVIEILIDVVIDTWLYRSGAKNYKRKYEQSLYHGQYFFKEKHILSSYYLPCVTSTGVSLKTAVLIGNIKQLDPSDFHNR